MYQNHSSPSPWGDFEVRAVQWLPELPGRTEPHLLTVDACLTTHTFPVSFPPSPSGTFWNHLPRKLLAIKPLSQHLLLEEPILKHPLNKTQIRFQPPLHPFLDTFLSLICFPHRVWGPWTMVAQLGSAWHSVDQTHHLPLS